MVDLYLQAMMHGELPSHPRSTPTKVKNKIELAGEKYINEYINSLPLEAEFGQDKLVTPAMRKAQIRHTLMTQMKSSEIDPYLSEAFNFLQTNGTQYLDGEHYRAMLEQFDSIDELIEKMNFEQDMSEDVGEFFNFDSNVAESILDIAVIKFQDEEYRTSLSLLVLLSLLNPEYYDIWFRQGISAQKCENYDLALKAYQKALQLKPDLIGAILFSVDCYLEKDLPEDAKSELLRAKLLSEEVEVDEKWLSFLKDLEDTTGWNKN